jgi:hypothetical protein
MRHVRAYEDYNTSFPLPYEADAGEGLAPFFLPEDEFDDRPYPSSNPFHYNDNLIQSNRLDRIARQLVGLDSRRTSRNGS